MALSLESQRHKNPRNASPQKRGKMSRVTNSGMGVSVGLLVKRAIRGTSFRLILAVISGDMSTGEAARRGKASEQSISTWKRQFLEGGKAGLVEGGKPGVNPRERMLLEEVEELKAALGEAHVELRVWKRSAEHRLGPTRISR